MIGPVQTPHYGFNQSLGELFNTDDFPCTFRLLTEMLLDDSQKNSAVEYSTMENDPDKQAQEANNSKKIQLLIKKIQEMVEIDKICPKCKKEKPKTNWSRHPHIKLIKICEACCKHIKGEITAQKAIAERKKCPVCIKNRKILFWRIHPIDKKTPICHVCYQSIYNKIIAQKASAEGIKCWACLKDKEITQWHNHPNNKLIQICRQCYLEILRDQKKDMSREKPLKKSEFTTPAFKQSIQKIPGKRTNSVLTQSSSSSDSPESDEMTKPVKITRLIPKGSESEVSCDLSGFGAQLLPMPNMESDPYFTMTPQLKLSDINSLEFGESFITSYEFGDALDQSLKYGY